MNKFRIISFLLLGLLLQQVVHHIVELYIISLLLKDFDQYSLGLSWDNWFTIHTIGSFVLVALGLWFGWWLWKKTLKNKKLA